MLMNYERCKLRLNNNTLLKLYERYGVVLQNIASATPVDSQITKSILKVS